MIGSSSLCIFSERLLNTFISKHLHIPSCCWNCIAVCVSASEAPAITRKQFKESLVNWSWRNSRCFSLQTQPQVCFEFHERNYFLPHVGMNIIWITVLSIYTGSSDWCKQRKGLFEFHQKVLAIPQEWLVPVPRHPRKAFNLGCLQNQRL